MLFADVPVGAQFRFLHTSTPGTNSKTYRKIAEYTLGGSRFNAELPRRFPRPPGHWYIHEDALVVLVDP